jgi:hypothetical protein
LYDPILVDSRDNIRGRRNFLFGTFSFMDAGGYVDKFSNRPVGFPQGLVGG